MKYRIGLVYSKGFGHSTTKYVDVADLAELSAALQNVGAQRAVLYRRDRFGDGHTEGQPFPVSALSDAHLSWLTEPPKEGMRGLFYDTKA